MLEVEVAGVFGNAYDLVFAFRSDIIMAELLSNRIFILEKLPRKRLIDDCHVACRRRILFGNTASSKDRIADDVKVSRGDSIPSSIVVFVGSGSRMSIHPNAGAPYWLPASGEYMQRATAETPGRLDSESWIRR